MTTRAGRSVTKTPSWSGRTRSTIAAAGGLQRRDIQRLLGGRRRWLLEARLAQDDPQRPEDLRLVVDHQNARTVVHATLSLRMAGRYKIFLGMAAGVGKTYRMLAEAQAQAEAGRDVVGRSARDPQPRRDRRGWRPAWRPIPRRRVPYRGVNLEEMDLPGDPGTVRRSCA